MATTILSRLRTLLFLVCFTLISGLGGPCSPKPTALPPAVTAAPTTNSTEAPLYITSVLGARYATMVSAHLVSGMRFEGLGGRRLPAQARPAPMWPRAGRQGRAHRPSRPLQS